MATHQFSTAPEVAPGGGIALRLPFYVDRAAQ
jgi:hypothetical protein